MVKVNIKYFTNIDDIGFDGELIFHDKIRDKKVVINFFTLREIFINNDGIFHLEAGCEVFTFQLSECTINLGDFIPMNYTISVDHVDDGVDIRLIYDKL